MVRPRHQGGGHRPPAGRRRRAEGGQRAPRDGDEPRPAGLPALPAGDAPRPHRSGVGRPRPVHPFQRALLADPVLPAVPVRLRAGALRPRVAANVGLPHPGPPRVPPHRRRRDHHRTAGPGRGQRRGHGHGRPPRARPVRPGRRAGRVAVRPPHLRHRRRRLHGGGRRQRGVLAGRAPAARQPDPVLRRQPHLDRGRHGGRVQRGRARALRGLRLARTAGRLRRGRRRPRAGDRKGQGRHRQAVDHRGAHDHRLAGTDPAEHRQGARFGPRRGRDPQDQGDPRLRPGREVRRRRRRARPHPIGHRPQPRGARRVAGGLRRVGRGQHEGLRAARADEEPHAARRAGPTRCRPGRRRRTASRTPCRPARHPARC